jgi:hypothetical protein
VKLSARPANIVRPSGSNNPPPPATVAKPADETDLATITLTPEAERRVGIELSKVERKPVRRRVEVEFVDASDAVLAFGPEPGAEIVAVGAAEPFGTEFGFGK